MAEFDDWDDEKWDDETEKVVTIDDLPPVPAALIFEIAFLDKKFCVNEAVFAEEVKRIIRLQLPYSEEDIAGPGLFEVYDARLWALIEEVEAELAA